LTGTLPPALPDEAVELCELLVSLSSPHTSFSGTGWLFHRLGATTYNQILPPNSPIPDCAASVPGGTGVYTARSLHASGCHALLGDGAVRFVSESIDGSLWRALGTTNSAEDSAPP
jgi:hypothetical protein